MIFIFFQMLLLGFLPSDFVSVNCPSIVACYTQPIQEQALQAAERTAAGRVPKPYVGRTLDTLRPPPAPSLFKRDWLRTLLCEG